MGDWEKDCLKWRGRVLTGKFKHWCYEWDELPVDETTPEWPCNCYKEFMKSDLAKKLGIDRS